MLTPLDIENKKFSKQVMNGYSVTEVDDFLDEITLDYEKLYKEVADLKNKVDEASSEVSKYKTIESTLQNTLVMAQSTAEKIESVAREEAEEIKREAENDAKLKIKDIEVEILSKQKELENIKKQFEVYKAKMESLLISQLELLKEIKEEQ